MKKIPDAVIADSQRLAQRVEGILSQYEDTIDGPPPAFENNSLMLLEDEKEDPLSMPPGYYNFEAILEEAEARNKRRRLRRKAILRIAGMIALVIAVFVVLLRSMIIPTEPSPVPSPTLPPPAPNNSSSGNPQGGGGGGGFGGGGISSGGGGGGGEYNPTRDSAAPPTTQAPTAQDPGPLLNQEPSPPADDIPDPLPRDCSEIDPLWATYQRHPVVDQLLISGRFQEVYEECKLFQGYRVPDFVKIEDSIILPGEFEEEISISTVEQQFYYLGKCVDGPEGKSILASSSVRDRIVIQIDWRKLIFTEDFAKELIAALQGGWDELFPDPKLTTRYTFAVANVLGLVADHSLPSAELLPCLGLQRRFQAGLNCAFDDPSINFKGRADLAPWLSSFRRHGCQRHHKFSNSSTALFEYKHSSRQVEFQGLLHRAEQRESFSHLFEQISQANLAVLATVSAENSFEDWRLLAKEMEKEAQLEKSTREFLAPLQQEAISNLGRLEKQKPCGANGSLVDGKCHCNLGWRGPRCQNRLSLAVMESAPVSSAFSVMNRSPELQFLPGDPLINHYRIRIKTVIVRYSLTPDRMVLSKLDLEYWPLWLPWMGGEAFPPLELYTAQPCGPTEQGCFAYVINRTAEEQIELTGISLANSSLSNSIQWLIRLHLCNVRTGLAFQSTHEAYEDLQWRSFECPGGQQLVALEVESEVDVRGVCLPTNFYY